MKNVREIKSENTIEKINNLIKADEETGEIIENPPFSVEEIKALIENATSLNKLVEAIDLARTLPEEDRKLLRIIYKEKEKSLTN